MFSGDLLPDRDTKQTHHTQYMSSEMTQCLMLLVNTVGTASCDGEGSAIHQSTNKPIQTESESQSQHLVACSTNWIRPIALVAARTS